jgi:hypothetical protein
MKFATLRFIVPVFWLLALAACTRREPTTWDSELSGPIAFGRLSLENVVADSLLQADETGLWHLIYDESLTDFELDSVIQIPDTTITKSYSLFVVGDFDPGFTLPIAPTQQITIQHPTAQLKKVRMKSGQLKYRLRSPVDGYLKCAFTIPGLTLQGVPQSIDIITQPPPPGEDFITEGALDLSGLELDLTGESGNSFNRIAAAFSVVVDPQASQPAHISPGDAIVFEMQFDEPRISYAKGYFGTHYYDLNEQVDFSALNSMPDGVLNLEQTSMQFTIRNAVGVDAQIDFSEISNYNQFTQTSVALEHPTLFDPLNITRAHDNGGVVSAYEYNYDVNASNSNLDAFFENLPTQFRMQGEVTINPLGNVSDGNDFIYTDDALQAGFKMDIPLKLGMQNIHLVDTLYLTNSTPEIPLDGKLMLWLKNGYPVEATVSLFILENGERISLATNKVIEAAMPSSMPAAPVPSETWLEIEANEELIAKLNQDNSLMIEVNLHTPGAPNAVGLYANQFIDFRLIVDGTYTLQYGE